MNYNIPEDIIKRICEGKCGLFVGSGLSVDAGLPSWSYLLESMIRKINVQNNTKIELYQLVEKNEYLIVAEFCTEYLSPGQLCTFMRDTFDNQNIHPGIIHLQLPLLPLSCIITTNYDKLLEETYNKAFSKVPPSYTYKDIGDLSLDISKEQFFILKAHGDIHRCETLILKRTDYQKIMFEEKAAWIILQTLFITRTFLFLGYSLTDPDFMLLIENLAVVFKQYNVMHYALLPDPGEVKKSVLKRCFNIEVIPYLPTEGHPEVGEFINKLIQKVNQFNKNNPFEGKFFI